MKNFKTYLAAILFIGALSATAFALTEDDPKKQSTETTTKAQCDQMKATASVAEPCCQHKETASATNCKEKASASCDSDAAKPACKDAASTASADCPKAKECAKAATCKDKATASAEKK
ncbi:MAG: hypothetical protein JXA72_12795 [Bacteroidales bacterium]|nr:hypothetical protein [Bacteroidales bacterium]